MCSLVSLLCIHPASYAALLYLYLYTITIGKCLMNTGSAMLIRNDPRKRWQSRVTMDNTEGFQNRFTGEDYGSFWQEYLRFFFIEIHYFLEIRRYGGVSSCRWLKFRRFSFHFIFRCYTWQTEYDGNCFFFLYNFLFYLYILR